MSPISVFFAIDTAAVLLAVQSPSPGQGNAFLPSLPKVLIIELHSVLMPHFMPDSGYSLMVLEFAVEQGGGKSVKFPPGCCLCSSFQPGVITEEASLTLAVDYTPEEIFQPVFIPVNHPYALSLTPIPNRFQPALILLVGMDVRVEKKSKYLMPIFRKSLIWIYKTRAAANMN